MRGLIGLGGTLACALSTAAAAQAPVTIDRAVYVERAINGTRSIEPATTLQRGDKVVLILTWQAHSATRGFTVSSRIPPTLLFQRAGSNSIEVSVDGGRSWGALDNMRVGNRVAAPEDVTNLRWKANASTGRMTFSAIVR
ncbi:hypothetical protein IDJ81_10480 [Tsuneonella flava]|uniref:Uncharacterized protein n=1 Tax=Tsuneonella flava TaxID=2055955 RepID=A0ABX7K799_9SPHN|nr:hypothetical protein [Tsuneonella flava]QSB43783.1 hypothetical protein IDJ81_10480 [Tsuneonella flava]